MESRQRRIALSRERRIALYGIYSRIDYNAPVILKQAQLERRSYVNTFGSDEGDLIMRMFQVKQTITYDLTLAAGTEQEAILKAKGIPLTQWTTEADEITAEMIDETDEIDDY